MAWDRGICIWFTLFFLHWQAIQHDMIINVYRKEKLVTIALKIPLCNKPTLLVVVSSHYLPRWIQDFTIHQSYSLKKISFVF